MSREFPNRYRDILDAVDEMSPGFWTEMADELRRMFEERVTTCGAIVREFPAQEEVAIQAVVPTQDEATETAIGAACEAAVQTGPEDPDLDTTSSDDRGAPIVESPWDNPQTRQSSPAPWEWSRPPEGSPSPDDPEPQDGCWNCGSKAHVARECPHTIKEAYCFRCGTKGYTVKTCPHCRQGWLAQGPYVKGRGHQGPEPPRGRRARGGSCPGPY